MKKKILILSAAGIAVVGLLFLAIKFSPLVSLIKGGGGKIIENGLRVSVEYTLFDEDGALIESNKGKEPLVYVHGSGQILPGLEKQLSGMKVNQQGSLRVNPEEGYGGVDPKAFQEVPRADLPPDAQKVGTVIVATSPEGLSFPARVSKVRAKTVVLDFNHPLAGKTLSFEVRILKIQEK